MHLPATATRIRADGPAASCRTDAAQNIAASCIAYSRWTGAVAYLVGLLVLASWLFGGFTLQNVEAGTANVKANTALCFAASGAALWLAVSNARHRRAAVRGLALLVFATATATLAEYALGRDFGIDQLIAADPGAAPPGRMAPATAFAFAVAAAALLLLDVHILAAQVAALGALTAGALGALGYLFGAQAIQRVEVYASMAPATAILLVVLSTGLLCAAPEAGLMRELTRPMLGSKAARRLILWSPPALLPLAWLRMQGETAGYYGPGFGLALMMALALATLAGRLDHGALDESRPPSAAGERIAFSRHPGIGGRCDRDHRRGGANRQPEPEHRKAVRLRARRTRRPERRNADP